LDDRRDDESRDAVVFKDSVVKNYKLRMKNMRTTFLRLVIAIALAMGAWFSWSEARLAARMGDATRQIATLRHAEVDRQLDAGTTATVNYWLGQYGGITADTNNVDADAHVLRTVANAAFRQSERQTLVGPAAAQQLDGVLQAYASALKASPRDVEAAYNYEYVARLRDQVARAPQGKPLKPAPSPALMAGDLPMGPTIHGRPGAPPPEAKMEDLQMLAPMEYGDREAQPEATPGAKRERKG
jgi:hypothetical protein